jgi:DNA-binding GntR family transcriptional regulator
MVLIEEQRLVPGDKLPSEVELAARLGVGRSTVRETMSHLELTGIVERKRGVGTVLVSTANPPAVGLETLASLESLAARQGWECGTRDVAFASARADAEQARRLQVVPGSELSMVRRTKTRDGRPFAEMLSAVPTGVIPLDALRSEFEDSITDLIVRRHAPPLRFAWTEITAVGASSEQAATLDVHAHDPLLVLDEIFIGGNEQVLAWNLLFFVPGRVRLELLRRPARADIAAMPWSRGAADSG